MFEEIKDLQQKELEILKELKRVCDANESTYFLAFGTLIGAARHQGFIPWDDDIDVCMNYPDYEKFEEVCETQLKEGFFLQTRDTDPEAGLSFNTLRMDNTTLITDFTADRDSHHGIKIDIYPIYNIADDTILRTFQLGCARMYMLLEAGTVPKNHGQMLKRVGGIVLSVIKGDTRERLKDFCRRSMARYENKATRKKALLFSYKSCQRLYRSEWFTKKTELPFEGEPYSVPVGYKQFLTAVYGDYMKLPPVEQQGIKLEHIIKYDTEKSYKEYKGTLYCVEK